MEEPQSFVATSINEAFMHIGALKETCEHLIPHLPNGQFKHAMTEILHGVYWLSKSVRSLDPITGMGQKVALTDFFDSDVPKRKKLSTPSEATPSQVTDIGGANELGHHSYPYKCFYVNIENKQYDTKGNQPLHPPSGQCYCGFKIVTDLDKQSHSTTTHSGGNWACYECGLKCCEKRSCWKHFRTQHLGIYVHYCTFDNCTSGPSGSRYGNEEQSEVWWHMEQKHGLQSPLGCPKCPKRFASKGSQIAHIIKCGTIDKSKFKTYQCPKCNKKYMEAKGLERHMARVHDQGEGDKHQYICSQCGQTFQYVQSLTHHQQNQH